MLRKLAKTVAFTVAVLCVGTTFAMAAEMTCMVADERGCSRAKGADGKEMKVSGMGAKASDKMDCTEKNGTMECKKK